MSTDLSASFDEQYININTKLKKRFMRKPNVSEATNEFIGLAIQCEHSEQPSFAGQTYVGAAKCEALAGNHLGEAEHYLSAARQFFKAEQKLSALKFYSPDRENLEAAIGCFMQALSKYPETSPIRTSIFMELASNLVSLNHKLEAVAYYEQALDTLSEGTMKLMYMRNLLNLLIDCGKFDIALEMGNTIYDSNTNIPEGILTEIQVSRVLLALLVEPDENCKPKSLKLLFTDLMNDTESEAISFNTDLRLKLQSIVICSAVADLQSLISVAADTKQYLTTQQSELLQALISEQRPDNYNH
ncbi:unnamed protein product [Parnassius apollo]|uniref:(apollo) hypothetical protein n=1 Tax=Parnassius apollo TaxID=110799 RepID=A0A8S3W6K2_PARAO|nr:unnamed protein product [Parnassius apollo]